MLIGVAELISKRIAWLARVLPKLRLMRGFGALTLGGALGVLLAGAGLLIGINGQLLPWMIIAAALCAAFAGLILREFHKGV